MRILFVGVVLVVVVLVVARLRLSPSVSARRAGTMRTVAFLCGGTFLYEKGKK